VAAQAAGLGDGQRKTEAIPKPLGLPPEIAWNARVNKRRLSVGRIKHATILTLFLLRDVAAGRKAHAATAWASKDAPRWINRRFGFSYYAGLGASEEFVRADLTDFQKSGFNWLRVWATCGLAEQDVSAVDSQGRPREPFLGKLQWLVAECDRRGLVVDVTLTRGKGGAGQLPDLPSHQRAIETLVEALKTHRNWYLDLARAMRCAASALRS
jgi:hypothetical protein